MVRGSVVHQQFRAAALSVSRQRYGLMLLMVQHVRRDLYAAHTIGSYMRRSSPKVAHAGPPWISGTILSSRSVTPSRAR